MASFFELLKKEWAVVKPALWIVGVAAVIAAGLGWWFADYHYQGEIAVLKDTLQNKDFPKPVVQTVTVPVADPTQKSIIIDLQGQLKEANQTIRDLARAGGAPPPRPSHPSEHPATSVNQTGGVTQGQGGTIGTVNQNGLPARSAFAAPLGNLYTEGYLILQKASILGLKDTQLTDLGHQFDAWRQKIVTWMNANMCSDAAAYFLKAHRSSLSFNGVPENQNRLLDTLSWSLDNLSDIKRNDAWDCK